MVVITEPAMIIMVIIVFIVLASLLFEMFYKIKLGQAVCKWIGKGIVGAFGYVGVFIGLTDIGIDAACMAFPV